MKKKETKTKKKIKITLKRSTIGRLTNQKLNAKALGLRKLNQSVIHADTAVIRGMVEKIRHLVTVEEV